MVHIAVDIGASSGRLVSGVIKQNKLEIKEVHRFDNFFTEQEGTLYWDIDYLLNEIVIGLQKVKKLGFDTCTVGIDTWAVDYVLLGKNGERLKEVVSYRDKRTNETIKKVVKKFNKKEIYRKTGIQFLSFNTIYQLYEENQEDLNRTDKIMMIPDYLNYRLTGKMLTETTNASTTQLLNIKNRQFDEELLQIIEIKQEQFPELVEPGHELGIIRNEWFPEYDLPHCKVTIVASHDTASAVVGTPGIEADWAYLSSGTWSLLGIETNEPIINAEALAGNYTNEWGVFNTYRFLKNIMGMWIIQEVRRKLSPELSYAEIVEEASKVEQFQHYIDFNQDRFLNPENMIEEIQSYCKETNQAIPKSVGELTACVYNNLAIIYSIAIKELETITNSKIQHLYIVGGGARNEFLNQLTANLSNKTVSTGSTESTAIGNLVMQMITAKKIRNLTEGRELIKNSFSSIKYTPADINRKLILEKYKTITKKEETYR